MGLGWGMGNARWKNRGMGHELQVRGWMDGWAGRSASDRWIGNEGTTARLTVGEL
jgi:hypothetical protein